MYCTTQALIGVAFSLGFIFGPMIGAGFSVLGKHHNEISFTMFQYPALFSLTMATIDIVLMLVFFKETLPKEKRVSQVLPFATLMWPNDNCVCVCVCVFASWWFQIPTGQVPRSWNHRGSLLDQPCLTV